MKYPNLGLYADLVECEDDLFDLINKNFFMIDSLWLMAIEDVVTELPLSPAKGDIYIYNSGIYSNEYSIQLFDGNEWQEVELKEGYWYYSKSQKDFYFFDGTDLIKFGERYGDVTGPETSLNNSMARYDGTTGKFITDSGIIVDDNDNISEINCIYSECIYSENATFNNADIINANIENNNVNKLYSTMSKIEESAGIHELKSIINYFDVDADGSTVDYFENTNFTSSSLFLIENLSGGKVTISNDGNISTGYPEDFIFLDGSSIVVLYNHILGTFSLVRDGGFGGFKILKVDTMANRDLIDDLYRFDGLVVYVEENNETYQLKGGILNANWDGFGSGGGGGGGSLEWKRTGKDIAPTEEIENGVILYRFSQEEENEIINYLVIPDSYKPEDIISINDIMIKTGLAGDVNLKLESHLIRLDQDFQDEFDNNVLVSDANESIELNGEINFTSANQFKKISFNVTDAIGEINSIQADAGMLIVMRIYRDVADETDNTSYADMITTSTSLKLKA